MGTLAQAIIDEQFSDLVVQYDSFAGVWTEMNMQHVLCGTKVWVQIKNAAIATLDFFAGIKEYVLA